MFGLGITEIIIIAIVLGILFLGSQKFIDLAKTAGKFSGELKKTKLRLKRN